MKGPSLVFYVVEATRGPGLSVRLFSHSMTASSFKEALTTSGFKAGDCVRMTLAPKRSAKSGKS